MPHELPHDLPPHEHPHDHPHDNYDVVVMGGGPAGATLGALLARTTSLRVAIFEKEVFPREHIGESFAHPLIPVLEESGALAKVLASDCWVKKYGGIFNWGDPAPHITFFDHANYLDDGVHRWAMHVNRPEFDQILLDHAADSGVHVEQGVSVSAYEPGTDGGVVTLGDGRRVGCGYFVDASGRRNSIATGKKRQWLSGYRNIAIWQHFTGGRPAQRLDGDWNVFRAGDLSPIGCFAFRDGWCWYIPVPKVVDGRRVRTHSIGIVTDPRILKEPGMDFTDPDVFLRTVQDVPMLRDLVRDVRPIARKMLTATNYSMINERFADHDGRWILMGDASYFVDPLFSSGVAFAAGQASAVALLLRATFDPDLPEEHKRDLWRDYDVEWHGMAETFSLSIDQWYHAIGKNNPDSVYWRQRGSTIDLDIREQTFQALLNTAFTPDLLQLITSGTRRPEDLDAAGPFVRATAMADPGEPLDDDVLELAPGAAIRASAGLDVPGFKAFIPPPPFEFPPELKAVFARYWTNPLAYGPRTPSPHAAPIPCHRFHLPGDPDAPQVRSLDDREDGPGLWAMLSAGPIPYRKLREQLDSAQSRLLRRLLRAGLVRVATGGTGGPDGSGVLAETTG